MRIKYCPGYGDVDVHSQEYKDWDNSVYRPRARIPSRHPKMTASADDQASRVMNDFTRQLAEAGMAWDKHGEKTRSG